MKHGYIRVAAATPDVKVADPEFNRERICEQIKEGIKRQAKLMVFPELCLTAYTCGDLFGQDALLRKARKELKGEESYIIRLLPYKTEGFLESYQRRICPIIQSFMNCVISSRETKYR